MINHSIIENMGQNVVVRHGLDSYNIKARVHEFKKKEYDEAESPQGIIVYHFKLYIKMSDLPLRPVPNDPDWVVDIDNTDYLFTELIDHKLTNMLICKVQEYKREIGNLWNFTV